MRLTLRHGYLPADLDGLLFAAPLRVDAKNIYNAGGGIDAAAPATQVVDALGTYIDPDTGLITPAQANVLRVGSGLDLASRLKGALFEELHRSDCLQSEDFANASWSKHQVSVAANDMRAPNGNLTADKIVEDTSVGASHFVRQSISVISGEKVVLSVFAKAGKRKEVRIHANGVSGQANADVWFDLNAGVKGTVGADVDDSGMDALSNGWYRCWIVFTSDATNTVLFDIRLGSGSETETYTGDGSSGLYLWRAQCEQNVSHPSSSIETTTVGVTVAADDIRFGNANEANLKASAGTIYLAVTHGETGAAADRYLFDSRVAGDADGIAILLQASDNNYHVIVRSGGVTVADLDSGETWVRGDTVVIAVTWKVNEFTLYIDGVQKAQDTAGAAPTAVNATLYLGQDNGNANQPTVQMAHKHIYDSVHIASRVLANSNEIKSMLGL
ncbi:hypothetical protein LCGC14_1321370 [marine sediment metagenome]|uniref:Uncharacterized protein n=1 Tax=marine sediment metagenome TaxID=412755 RepID=A0A0F9KJJ0_9ZZZZ